MDLSLNPEQRSIVESAAVYLADASASEAVRGAVDCPDGIDRALWRGIADLGWCGVHLRT